MWVWIQLHMEPTLSVMGVVSTCTVFCRGACERSVNGVVGAQKFTHLTIVKYLISANDEPSMAHEGFSELPTMSQP
jgi:hypothetical protein